MNGMTLSQSARFVDDLGDLQVDAAELQSAVQAMETHLYPLQAALPQDITSAALASLKILAAQLNESLCESQKYFAEASGVDAVENEYHEHVGECNLDGLPCPAQVDYIALVSAARERGAAPAPERPATIPRHRASGRPAKATETSGPGTAPVQMVFSAVGVTGQ